MRGLLRTDRVRWQTFFLSSKALIITDSMLQNYSTSNIVPHMANKFFIKAKLFVPVGLALILTLAATYLFWSVTVTALAHRQLDRDTIGSSTSIHSRAPSAKELYKQSVTRGDALFKIMTGKKPTPASRFTDPADLALWGWEATKKVVPDAYVLKSYLEHIDTPMRELGISTSAEKNVVVDMTHSKETTHGGRVYPVRLQPPQFTCDR